MATSSVEEWVAKIPKDKHYQYDPLPTPTSIRLVTVKPAELGMESVVELSMRTVDLLDNPDYEALSYTWGRPVTVFPTMEARDDWTDHPVPISCDDKMLLVTRNLYAYLYQWRKILELSVNPPKQIAARIQESGLSLPAEMWIDAVCINQMDVDEKNAQVAMMGRIYNQTRKITVWLGPEDSYTRPALEILFKLSRTPQLRARAASQLDDDDACSFLGLPSMTSSHWWSVFAFLQRSWFRRAWVIQELALSPKSQIQCGLLTLTWDVLTRACINLTESGLGDMADNWAWFEIEGPKMNMPLFLDDLTPLISYTDRHDSERNLFTTLPFRVGSSYMSVTMLESISVGNAEGFGPEELAYRLGKEYKERITHIPLLHLLDNCRGFESTDPRDKIYAFLEIAKRAAHKPLVVRDTLRPIVADYRRSTVEVFIEAAWHILLGGDDLQILCRQVLWEPLDPPSNVKDLPSWVPNWSQGLATMRLTSYEDPKWSASGNLRWTPPSNDRLYESILLVEGILVDIIVETSQWSECLSRTKFPTAEGKERNESFSLTKAAVVAAHLPRCYPWTPGNQAPGEVLWRTLIADTAKSEHPASMEYHAAFKEDWLKTGKNAAREYHTEEGIGDPDKEAEWVRYWQNDSKLFPEDDEQESKDILEAVEPEDENSGTKELHDGKDEGEEEIQHGGEGTEDEEAASGPKINVSNVDDEAPSPTPPTNTEVALQAPRQGKRSTSRNTRHGSRGQSPKSLSQIDQLFDNLMKEVMDDFDPHRISNGEYDNDDSNDTQFIGSDDECSNDAPSDDDNNDTPGHSGALELAAYGNFPALNEADSLPQPKPAKKLITDELSSRRHRICAGRRVFRTENNYLGVAPRAIRPGDQVWVLKGAGTPLVLREKENGRFTLVGEAYVHGIMHGEVVERDGFAMREVELE
jgi:hypothetical protein